MLCSLMWEGDHHLVQKHLPLLSANCLIFFHKQCVLCLREALACAKVQLAREQTVRGSKYLTCPKQWFHIGHLRESPLKISTTPKHFQPFTALPFRIRGLRSERLQGFITLADFV